MNLVIFLFFKIEITFFEYLFLTISGLFISVINLPTNKWFFSPASPILINSLSTFVQYFFRL